MDLINTVAELRQVLDNKLNEGKSIGFVPTMGALHGGHLSLISKSLAENDVTVCSIFVNPTQFNDKKDLQDYPRTLAKDGQLLQQSGCHIAFIPNVDEIYPLSPRAAFPHTYPQLESVMEGAARPGHFNGVKTVVDILFDMVKPVRSYFGEKDFQQLAVIRAMVAQLHPDITIVPCITVRESDGLAMSSRNARLTEEEREAAGIIPRVLSATLENVTTHSVSELLRDSMEQLWSQPGFALEYFELRESDTLALVTDWESALSPRAFIAGRAGRIRLIDNMLLIP